jgi:hypothetical protein
MPLSKNDDVLTKNNSTPNMFRIGEKDNSQLLCERFLNFYRERYVPASTCYIKGNPFNAFVHYYADEIHVLVFCHEECDLMRNYSDTDLVDGFENSGVSATDIFKSDQIKLKFSKRAVTFFAENVCQGRVKVGDLKNLSQGLFKFYIEASTVSNEDHAAVAMLKEAICF